MGLKYCNEIIKKNILIKRKLWAKKVKRFLKGQMIFIYLEAKIERIRVRDFCHITWEFKGFAHKVFNLNFTFSNNISVVSSFFFKFKGYHNHLVKQETGKFEMSHLVKPETDKFEMTFKTIRWSTEKYMSFTFLWFRNII